MPGKPGVRRLRHPQSECLSSPTEPTAFLLLSIIWGPLGGRLTSSQFSQSRARPPKQLSLYRGADVPLLMELSHARWCTFLQQRPRPFPADYPAVAVLQRWKIIPRQQAYLSRMPKGAAYALPSSSLCWQCCRFGVGKHFTSLTA